MLGINLSGVMYCMRQQLRHLPTPGGSIVNVASTAGLHGLPKSAAYSASKHGVIGLGASAAGEFGPAGIRVNSVCPYVSASTSSHPDLDSGKTSRQTSPITDLIT